MLDLSKDGGLLAIGSRSEVRLWQWDGKGHQPLFDPVQLAAPPGELRFSDDGRRLGCLAQNKIWVMNTATGTREREFAADASSIAFLGQTERIITITPDPASTLGLFDFRTGQDCKSPYGHPEFDPRRHASRRVKERIAQAGEPDDFYSRWAKWMLEDRMERPVKPFQP